MLTLPLLLDETTPPIGPRTIGRILLDERKLAAAELVNVFELLAEAMGRDAAVRDPRVRAAARRYRVLCGTAR
ncbi:MAG: hypothetical protein BGP25_05230 [Lysobacterales bacterium 63-13]|nr:MAG: hypothetical protein BGP25_05230 [Xanthomonadales bacterium 63-13]